MTTRQDYLAALDSLVSGSHPLGVTEKEMAIAKAMLEHSKYRPLSIVDDVAGADVFDYALAASLPSWSDELSSIRSVEYPVDDDEQGAELLDPEQWTIYAKPSGKYLRFLDLKPETGETFRVAYTGLHACTDQLCTVAIFDEAAVQALAASFFCRMVATRYALENDSTIEADSVDHKSKRADFETQAAKYRAEYDLHMGIPKNQGPAPASGQKDWDANYPGGADRLTHPRRHR